MADGIMTFLLEKVKWHIRVKELEEMILPCAIITSKTHYENVLGDRYYRADTRDDDKLIHDEQREIQQLQIGPDCPVIYPTQT